MIRVYLTTSGTEWADAVPVPASMTREEYDALPSKTVFVRDGYILDLSEETSEGFSYDEIVGKDIGTIRFLFPAESDADFKQLGVFVAGSGDFFVPGSASFEHVYAGAGNDTIDDREIGGGQGFFDVLYGGAGDDTYLVHSSDTEVREVLVVGTMPQPGTDAGGNDRVIASTFYNLPGGQRIETLQLDGSGFGGGNEFGNSIIGDGLDELIIGRGGADTLNGNGGADTLVGGDGDDRLFGGSGSDLFLFLEEPGRDSILDFGADDVLLTRTEIYDSNRDGIIHFGENSLLDFSADASVRIENASGRLVTRLEYDGSYEEGGVTYYVYSLVGSAAGVATAAAQDLSEIAFFL